MWATKKMDAGREVGVGGMFLLRRREFNPAPSVSNYNRIWVGGWRGAERGWGTKARDETDGHGLRDKSVQTDFVVDYSTCQIAAAPGVIKSLAGTQIKIFDLGGKLFFKQSSWKFIYTRGISSALETPF